MKNKALCGVLIELLAKLEKLRPAAVLTSSTMANSLFSFSVCLYTCMCVFMRGVEFLAFKKKRKKKKEEKIRRE